MPMDLTINMETLRDSNESEAKWKLRRDFIVANYKTVRNFQRLLTLSRCFVNVQTRGCAYPDHIMKQLQELTASDSGSPELQSSLDSSAMPLVKVETPKDDGETGHGKSQLAHLGTLQTTEQTTIRISVSLEEGSQIQKALHLHLPNPISPTPPSTGLSGGWCGALSVDEPAAQGQELCVRNLNQSAGESTVALLQPMKTEGGSRSDLLHDEFSPKNLLPAIKLENENAATNTSLVQVKAEMPQNDQSKGYKSDCQGGYRLATFSANLVKMCTEVVLKTQAGDEGSCPSICETPTNKRESCTVATPGHYKQELKLLPEMTNVCHGRLDVLTETLQRYETESNSDLTSETQPDTQHLDVSLPNMKSEVELGVKVDPCNHTAPSISEIVAEFQRHEQKSFDLQSDVEMEANPCSPSFPSTQLSGGHHRFPWIDQEQKCIKEEPQWVKEEPAGVKEEPVKTKEEQVGVKEELTWVNPLSPILPSAQLSGGQFGTETKTELKWIQKEPISIKEEPEWIKEESEWIKEESNLNSSPQPLSENLVWDLQSAEPEISGFQSARFSSETEAPTWECHFGVQFSDLRLYFDKYISPDCHPDPLFQSAMFSCWRDTSVRPTPRQPKLGKGFKSPRIGRFLPLTFMKDMATVVQSLQALRIVPKDDRNRISQKRAYQPSEDTSTESSAMEQREPAEKRPCLLSVMDTCSTERKNVPSLTGPPECFFKMEEKPESFPLLCPPEGFFKIKQEPGYLQDQSLPGPSVGFSKIKEDSEDLPVQFGQNFGKVPVESPAGSPFGVFNPLMLTPPSAQPCGGQCEHKRVKTEEKPEHLPVQSPAAPFGLPTHPGLCVPESSKEVQTLSVPPVGFFKIEEKADCLPVQSTPEPPLGFSKAEEKSHLPLQPVQFVAESPEEVHHVSLPTVDPFSVEGSTDLPVESPLGPCMGFSSVEGKSHLPFQPVQFIPPRSKEVCSVSAPPVGFFNIERKEPAHQPLQPANHGPQSSKKVQFPSVPPVGLFTNEEKSDSLPIQSLNHGPPVGFFNIEGKRPPVQMVQFVQETSMDVQPAAVPPVGFFNTEGKCSPMVQFVPATCQETVAEKDVEISDYESDEVGSEEEFEDYSDVDEIWESDGDVDDDSQLAEIMDSSSEALWFFPDWLDEEVFGMCDETVECSSTPEPPPPPSENMLSPSEELGSENLPAFLATEAQYGQNIQELNQYSPVAPSTQFGGGHDGAKLVTEAAEITPTSLQKQFETIEKSQVNPISPIALFSPLSGGCSGLALGKEAAKGVPVPKSSTPLPRQPAGKGTDGKSSISSAVGQKVVVVPSKYAEEADDSGVQRDLPDGDIFDRIERMCQNIFQPHMQGLCGFVLFYCEHSKSDAAEVLNHSAKLSKMGVKYTVNKETLGFRCTVEVNKTQVTSAVRAKESDARKTASSWAIQVLRRYCWVLIRKAGSKASDTRKCDACGRIETSGVSESQQTKTEPASGPKSAGNTSAKEAGSQNSAENHPAEKTNATSSQCRPRSSAASVHEPIAADNFGRKMLEKMGWKGGGLGKNRTGIQEPLVVCEVQHEEGIILDAYMVVTTSSASKHLKGRVTRKRKRMEKYGRFSRHVYFSISKNSSAIQRKLAALNLRKGGIAFVSAGIQQPSGMRLVMSADELDQFRRMMAFEHARRAMFEQARRGMAVDQARLMMLFDPARQMAVGPATRKMIIAQARQSPSSISHHLPPGPVNEGIHAASVASINTTGSDTANVSPGPNFPNPGWFGAPPTPMLNMTPGSGLVNVAPGCGLRDTPPGPSLSVAESVCPSLKVNSSSVENTSCPSSRETLSSKEGKAGPCSSMSSGDAKAVGSDKKGAGLHTVTSAQNDLGVFMAKPAPDFHIRVVDVQKYILKVFNIKLPLAEEVEVSRKTFDSLGKDRPGFLSKGTPTFKQQVRDMLTPYQHCIRKSDIVFLPEFDVSERTTIRTVVKELKLVKCEEGKGDDCRITVRPDRSATQLVAYVVACGGETKQFRILPPRRFVGKENSYR